MHTYPLIKCALGTFTAVSGFLPASEAKGDAELMMMGNPLKTGPQIIIII